MSKPTWRIVIVALAVAALGGGGWFWWQGRVRPVRAEDLQGEWVQDPEFLQHAGADLDAQKSELEHFENYQFAFHGTRLTGWRLIFEDGAQDGMGWAQGRGVSFDGDYALVPGKPAVLKFADQSKAPQEARLAWDRDRLMVTLGPRTFRLVRQEADQLRVRNLIPGKER